ncbi:MAG: hypothetical protein NTY14_02305 [Candidatus Omnitrophica bacterium]|nr:hypothetical protein [Candidatus Omnitrophota bacterium]
MDNSKVRLKAQVSLEFVITFVMLVLFVVLATKMFVWFGARIVNRHNAYETTRNMNTGTAATGVDFFNQGNGNTPMNIFHESQ